jgi:tetratricopeptide (TPR) repeat protein
VPGKITKLFSAPKILSVVIAVLTFTSFSPTLFNDYTNWDDPVYILENPLVKTIAPLSPQNIKMIFTSSVHGSYLPLPILTYAVEYRLAPFNTKLQHTTNLLLHIANAVLAFWFVYALLGDMPAAFLTALLFALCPLRVESVAWLTQRKDLLYLLFSLLGFLAHLKYVRTKNVRFVLGTAGFFLLALLSKPQAIAFPAFLVLIEVLDRKKPLFESIKSKLPFFVVSAVFFVISVKTLSPEFAKQSTAGIFSGPEKFFLSAFALFLYLVKSIFPFYLSCLYPFPYNITGHFPWTVYSSTAAVAAMGFFIFRKSADEPVYRFGWLWFLAGVILPILNIWVGGYFICDHYTYLASIGLYLIIAVAALRLIRSKAKAAVREWTIALLAVYILFLGIGSLSYSFTWNNSATLWSHAIDIFPDLPIAYNNRAAFYLSFGLLDKALEDSNKALSLVPDAAFSHFVRGNIYAQMGSLNAALEDFTEAVRLDPNMTEAKDARASIIRLKKGNP